MLSRLCFSYKMVIESRGAVRIELGDDAQLLYHLVSNKLPASPSFNLYPRLSLSLDPPNQDWRPGSRLRLFLRHILSRGIPPHYHLDFSFHHYLHFFMPSSLFTRRHLMTSLCDSSFHEHWSLIIQYKADMEMLKDFKVGQRSRRPKARCLVMIAPSYHAYLVL